MARTPKNFSIEQVATTDLTTLGYIVPKDTVSSATLVLTNTTSSIIEVSIFINDTVSDFIFDNVKIPAGVGKRKRIISLPDEKLNSGFLIKVQATTSSAFNVFLSGSELRDDTLV